MSSVYFYSMIEMRLMCLAAIRGIPLSLQWLQAES